MILFLSFVFVWWLIGIGSFIYWWTTDHNLYLNDLLWAVWFGMMGPFAFLTGWSIHGKKGLPTLIMKKRD